MKLEKSDITEEVDQQIEEALSGLKDQYKLYVHHYCRTFNKKSAAIAAQFSEKSAATIGFNIYNRPEIRAAIAKYVKIIAFSPEENVEAIRRLAEINLSDYFIIKNEIETIKKRVPVYLLIKEAKEELEIEHELLFDLPKDARPLEKTTILNRIAELERQIRRDEKIIDRKPGATRFAYVETEVPRKVLNIDKVVEDNVPIKSVKYKETGVEIELHSISEARALLARIGGSFEKDNNQRREPGDRKITVEIVPPKPPDE